MLSKFIHHENFTLRINFKFMLLFQAVKFCGGFDYEGQNPNNGVHEKGIGLLEQNEQENYIGEHDDQVVKMWRVRWWRWLVIPTWIAFSQFRVQFRRCHEFGRGRLLCSQQRRS